ncbi:MAG: LamG domain-containing protein [Candidatus Moraniibacteriota bacterium]|nr:MAG: LamG domain-containing protein [Candidatus Moranbacteria bacterium]
MSTSLTKHRIIQWMGIILALSIIGGGYYYFRAQAGIKTGVVSPTGSLTSGLVGYWTFDRAQLNGTTAYDRSASKYHGSLTNGPTLTDGMLAQAVDLDGSNDYVTMNDQPNLDFGDAADLSISGWFYRDTFTTDDAIVAKINGLLPGETGYVVYIDDATDQLIFRVGDGIDSYTVSSTPTYTTAQWVHFAVVWDQDSAANTKLYANGQAIASTSSGTIGNVNDLTNALGFRLGNTFAGSDYFDGKLDDMRVYNRALTATEIQTLYEFRNADQINSSSSQPQGTGRLDSGLAGYWQLDDGSGTSATDSSTNGNTGTLNNGPTWTTGQIGGAVDFDGSDDNISTSKTMANLGTVSAWVNTTATINSSASYYALYATASGNSFFLSFNGFGGENRWDFSYRGNFGTTVRIVGPTYTSNTQQGWHHLTATWDVNSGATLYIDGQRASSTSTTTSSFNSMSFGMSTNSLARWVGKLDEVRMYSRVLSADEVANLYRLTSPTGVDTSLKGYWSFNGKDISGTTAYDRSGAGNNGTLTNGPTATQGKVGQGLNFDGTDDYVAMGDINAIDGITNLTMVGWFKRASTNAHLTIGKSESSTYRTNINFYNDGNVYLNIGDNGISYGYFASNDTEWHHLVMVFDGSQSGNANRLRVYFDGVAVTLTFSGTIPAATGNTSDICTVDRNTANSSYSNGKIDEVRLYNRVLSATEIQSLYTIGQSDETNTGKSQPQGTGNLDSSLAGYWKLDDGSGTSATDSSTNGNTGTLTNGPTWTTGQIGGAVDFDGSNDYVTVADNTTLDITQTITLSTWAKFDDFSSPHLFAPAKYVTTGNQRSYRLYTDSGTTQLNFSLSSDGTSGNTTTLSYSTSNLSTGIWTHIVGTYDGSTMRLYVNGTQVNSTTRSGNIYASTAPLIIGADENGSTYFHNGQIDEVRLYNRALSVDEVASLYRLTSPTGVDTSLKGYWSFNGKDISGTTAYDRSGAGNNGTLTNGPTATQGKVGQALSFDGSNDYVNLGTGSSIRYTTTGSLAVWVKTSCTGICVIIGGNSDTELGYNLFLDSGTLKYRQDKYSEMSTPWTGVYNDGNWHFIVVSKSGSSGTLYVDNVSKATSSGLGGSWGANPIYIGNEYNRSYYFSGSIDELRIYNTALTVAQVAALYNQGR